MKEIIKIIVGPGTKYQTITAALEAIKQYSSPCLIEIKNGIYNEKLRIIQDNIQLLGESREKTIIIYNDYAKMIDENGKEYTTFKTPTITVLSNSVTLSNLSIINDAGPGNLVGQTVALAVYGDQIKVDNCLLKSYQDTLFTGPLPDDLKQRHIGFLPKEELTSGLSRQIYQNCQILGTIDFIFGGAFALFENCIIECRPAEGTTYIAAPATSADNEFGFIFFHCLIKGESKNLYLARPWREYGSCCFLDCSIDIKLNEDIFSIWEGTNRHLTSRFAFMHPQISATSGHFVKAKYSKKEIRKAIVTIHKLFE